MIELQFTPSYVDYDVWMNDCVSHDEYVSTWVDNTIYELNDTNGFYESLQNYGNKLKVVGPPTHHLRGYFKQVKETELMMTWEENTYVKIITIDYGQKFV